MLPVVVCFYVYDIRHGAVYLTSGEISCFDYILYTVCAVELLCCLTSVYIPNSITATLKILLSIAFYFFIRTFIRFRSQFAFLYKVKNDLKQGDGTPFSAELPLLVKASDFPHHSTAIGTQIVG